MLKKVPVVILTLLLITNFLFAQVTEETDVVSSDDAVIYVEPVLTGQVENLKTQHIQWSAVKRASGYAIDLQQKVDGIWQDVNSFEVEEPEYDFRLVPGYYRFRISALNAIGKRGNPSDWAEFELVDDSQPVLHRQTFPVNEKYGVPELRRTDAAPGGTETVTIRGINIFNNDTFFALVPASKENRAFLVLDKQVRVDLPVVSKNAATNSVRVSVDWSKLVPGYYNLLVERATGESDQFEVLVQPLVSPGRVTADLPLRFSNGMGVLDAVSTEGIFIIACENLQAETVFSLIPADVISYQDNFAYEYPATYAYASGYARETVPLSWISAEAQKVIVQAEPARLRPGYYKLRAELEGVGAAESLILVQANNAVSPLPEITGISGKLDKDNGTIALTIKTDSALFSEDQADQVHVYCVEEKDQYGIHRRFPALMTSASRNGKKAVFEASTSSLTPGVYALLIENEAGMRYVFFQLADDYDVKLIELTEAEEAALFLRIADYDERAAWSASRTDRAGLKMPQDLPAFKAEPLLRWEWEPQGSFPNNVAFETDTLTLSVLNRSADQSYTSEFKMIDDETVSMLQGSEGISFESLVTSHDNKKTTWSLSVKTTAGNVEIPIGSELGKLSQTIVIWGDFGINPKTITGLTFVTDAKDPDDANTVNSLKIFEARTWSSLDPVKKLTFKDPLFLTGASVFLGYTPSPMENGGIKDDLLGSLGVPTYMNLSLFDTGWFTLNAVYAPAGPGKNPMVGTEFQLSIPNDWVRPYVGIGWQYWGSAMWNPIYAGVILFKYVDFRFMRIQKQMTLADWGVVSAGSASAGKTARRSVNWFELGVHVPFRSSSVEYKEGESTSVSDSVFLTDVSFTMQLNVLSDMSRDHLGSYSNYLNNMSAGVRLLNLEYFAVDTSVGVIDMPVEKPLDFGAIDLLAELKQQIPFAIGSLKFVPYAGLGAGFTIANKQYTSGLVVSLSAGLKIGKYLTVSVNGRMFGTDFDSALKIAKEVPFLAPASFLTNCRDWRLGVGISIPLNGK